MNLVLPTQTVSPLQGWQCPLCGMIYAPFVTQCPCRYNQQFGYVFRYTSATSAVDENGDVNGNING